MDRGAWQAIVHVAGVGHDLATKPPQDSKRRVKVRVQIFDLIKLGGWWKQ